MKDVSREERWSIQLVQATRLAQQDAFADAVGHTRVVIEEVSAALEAEAENQRLSRLKTRAQRQLENLQAQLDESQARAQALVQSRRDGAEEEMQWEIPKL